MGLFGPTLRDITFLQRRVQSLEAIVAVLAERQGMNPAEIHDLALGGPEVAAQVRLLQQQGRTVAAVRLLRRHTGLSLVEAKNAVERL